MAPKRKFTHIKQSHPVGPTRYPTHLPPADEYNATSVFVGASVVAAFHYNRDVLQLMLEYADVAFEWSLVALGTKTVAIVSHLALATPSTVLQGLDYRHLGDLRGGLYRTGLLQTDYAFQYVVNAVGKLVPKLRRGRQPVTVNGLWTDYIISSCRDLMSDGKLPAFMRDDLLTYLRRLDHPLAPAIHTDVQIQQCLAILGAAWSGVAEAPDFRQNLVHDLARRRQLLSTRLELEARGTH
jgi:hypothetical protein